MRAFAADQDIHRAIVVEITDGHPTSGKRFGKHRAALRAYILKTFTRVPEQQQGLLILHLTV